MATPTTQICASYVLTGIEAISAPNGGDARFDRAVCPSRSVKGESVGSCRLACKNQRRHLVRHMGCSAQRAALVSPAATLG
jgi:hypothetical protein